MLSIRVACYWTVSVWNSELSFWLQIQQWRHVKPVSYTQLFANLV